MNALFTLLVLLQAVPPPQDPLSEFASLRGDSMTGLVLDPHGKPVEGAVVRMDLGDPSVPFDGVPAFGGTGLHDLRYTRLPRGITGADGRFLIQLTRDQRRLGLVSGFQLSLVIEKEGFRRWQSLVGTCPGRVGFVEARLATVEPGEFLEGRLVAPAGHEGPLSGGIAVLWDLSAQPAFAPSQMGLVARVEADGTFRVPRQPPTLPVEPWFTRATAGTAGIHLRPAVPGFEGALSWFPSETDRCEIELLPVRSPAPALALQCPEGEKPASVTVLYRSSGAVWTCERPFGNLAAAGEATLAGIEADDFCGAALAPSGVPVKGAVSLVPLPPGPVTLQIRGPHGEPLGGAEVEIVGVRDTISVPFPLPWPGRRPLFYRRTDAKGAVEIPAQVFRTAAHLQVRAEGHAPLNGCLSAFVRRSVLSLALVPTGRVLVTVKDQKGRPVEGASLLFQDQAHTGSSLAGPPPRTDAAGTFRGTLHSGTPGFFVYHEGFALAAQRVQVLAMEENRIDVTLTPGASGFVRVVGPTGTPLAAQGIRAFVPGSTEANADMPLISLPASVTDRQGRARIDGVGAGAKIQHQIIGSDAVVESPHAEVHQIRAKEGPLSEILIRIPPGTEQPAVEVVREARKDVFEVTNLGAGDLVIFVRGAGKADVSVSAPGLTRLEAKGVELQEGKRTVVDLRANAEKK